MFRISKFFGRKNAQLALWIGALAVGVLLGWLNIAALNAAFDFIATIYTRIFQLLAVPTIALAVIVTLATLGADKATGTIFRRALAYTLGTTLVAALVGAGIYLLIGVPILHSSPFTPPSGGVGAYTDHLLSVVPNNLFQPLLEGNVLSVLILAFAIGLGLSRLPQSEGKQALLRLFGGAQELLFFLIRAFIRTLPLGILAFAAQLVSQVNAGIVVEQLGRYTAVILLSNVLQIFLVLPLFLMAHRIQPWQAFRAMSPALLTAFFTKSSAATLPLTIDTAEGRAGVSPRVARMVLPLCTTINMNGCAAFIVITSLFVMQGSGMPLSWGVVLLWVLLSVVTAVGNAGVPMGCYFLTLSLMTGIGAEVGIMGLILPIYTIIDMVETAENVWSDSCVALMTEKALPQPPAVGEKPVGA